MAAEAQKKLPRVKRVIVWANGMVMVFGYDGQQIPDLQGRKEDVWPAVLKAADSETVFEENRKWGERERMGLI